MPPLWVSVFYVYELCMQVRLGNKMRVLGCISVYHYVSRFPAEYLSRFNVRMRGQFELAREAAKRNFSGAHATPSCSLR